IGAPRRPDACPLTPVLTALPQARQFVPAFLPRRLASRGTGFHPAVDRLVSHGPGPCGDGHNLSGHGASPSLAWKRNAPGFPNGRPSNPHPAISLAEAPSSPAPWG